MMKGQPVINWWDFDPKLTEGLRGRFDKTDPLYDKPFATIRLASGNKPLWDSFCDEVGGDDKPVAITISPPEGEPAFVLGQAKIKYVCEGTLQKLRDMEVPLETNIGAKSWQQVLEDMSSVYQKIGIDITWDTHVVCLEMEPWHY